MTIVTDTICAISTPAGTGGIAVARVAGPEAFAIVDKIWKGKSLSRAATHTAHLGTILDTADSPLDQAVATVFRAPGSFTGDNVVELSVHGSPYVQRELLASLIKAGCRMAEAGEFTRRAFVAGKIDLAQAEAVADVIAADSRAAHRIAISQLRGGFSARIASLRDRLTDLAALLELELDFSEEDVEFASRTRLLELARDINSEVTRLHNSFASGNAIKQGIPVAIAGATNAGKSSLLNALLGEERAIVSDIHGTTRDTIEETMTIGDYQFRFIDTAGLRDTADTIEQQGIERTRRAISRARITLLVIDPTAMPDAETIAATVRACTEQEIPGHLIAVLNKADIAGTSPALPAGLPADTPAITISALTGFGLDNLRDALVSQAAAEAGNASEGILVTNARHAEALARAIESSARVIDGLTTGLTGDLIALDLRQTISHLSAILGDIPSSAILSTIFSRFCIGK